jgi:hypothetical protein
MLPALEKGIQDPGKEKSTMKQAHHQASVQRDMLRLRETWGEMLCLSAPGSPTQRSYRAVLQVSPINLSLKAEDEQEAIIERFAALIKSLSFSPADPCAQPQTGPDALHPASGEGILFGIERGGFRYLRWPLIRNKPTHNIPGLPTS